MQTPQQVMNSLLRRKPADRVALHDYPWPDALKKWVTQGYPTNEKGEPVDFSDHFELDMVGVGGWINNFPKREVYDLVQETDEWHIHRDGWGAQLKYWKNKSGTPEHVAFYMVTRQIWENEYRPRLLDLETDRVQAKECRDNIELCRKRNAWTHVGHGFVWETMRQSMGDVCLYESMVLDPEWLHDFNTVLTGFYKTHMKYLFDQAGLPDGAWIYEDLGYKDRLFCSPQQYAEIIFPYFRQIVEFYHSYNLPVVLHTCGMVEPALDMIVDVGFDAVHPMEVKAGNDPLRIAAKYKDKLVLIGGLDERILESHDHALIRRSVGELVDNMKRLGARYVFASDHSISTNVNYDDYRVAVDEYRKHMYY